MEQQRAIETGPRAAGLSLPVLVWRRLGRNIINNKKEVYMKKMLIWSSENEFDEDFREELVLTQKEEFGEDYEPSEEEIDEDLAELNGIYLEDERNNLDVNVDGVIIAFADLGLWNGRRRKKV